MYFKFDYILILKWNYAKIKICSLLLLSSNEIAALSHCNSFMIALSNEFQSNVQYNCWLIILNITVHNILSSIVLSFSKKLMQWIFMKIYLYSCLSFIHVIYVNEYFFIFLILQYMLNCKNISEIVTFLDFWNLLHIFSFTGMWKFL